MSDRDKGAVQRLDGNSKRLDKGAVEKHVAASGTAVPVFMHHYTKNIG